MFPSGILRSSIVNHLKQKIQARGSSKLDAIKSLKKEHGSVKLGDVNVAMTLGGMRGIPAMLTETSYLDPLDGIKYQGHSLFDCNRLLPKAKNGEIGLPEASFWLLLTGDIPTEEESTALNAELSQRSLRFLNMDPTTSGVNFIKSLSGAQHHPMTQLSMGLMHQQSIFSDFAKKYRAGQLTKQNYWEVVLEDSLTILSQIHILSAIIYRQTFHADSTTPSIDPNLDWAGNYADMLKVSTDEQFREITRLYLMLHADHEGGNVSAHATHLVGSSLADPFISLAAGLNGLAGPLHGLANQECLRWLEMVRDDLQKDPSKSWPPSVEDITKYAQDTLSSGQVIPGFGHAVLRTTDPRYMLEREFALKHMANDPMVKLVDVCFHAIPPVLKATGKVANPYPNVDAHSGVCMQHYGLREADYYTVVFAVSRAIGVLSQLVWSRLLGLPIERPKSVTSDWIRKQLGN